MKLNLHPKVRELGDSAPDCEQNCGVKSLAQIATCEANHKLCMLCGRTINYGSHQSAQPSGKYSGDVDHKKPVSKGGTNDMFNLRVVCWRCNRQKGNQ